MNGFAADWLQTREPFDAVARNRDFARRFADALGNGQNGPRCIVDLAAGSGANFRALAPLIDGDQDWLLIDHDAALLEAQAPAIARWAQQQGWPCSEIAGGVAVQNGAAIWRARAQQLDLANRLEQIDFTTCDGVTTAAFLDLVSRAWLDRLCTELTAAAKPLLAVLTVDGRRRWQPPLPADAQIHSAFKRHQRGDKGFGPAAGHFATSDLAERLMTRGYAVSSARSDWQITAEHPAMLRQMVDEAAAVARAAEPAAIELIAQWSTQRSAQIQSAHLALEVGHLDLLALPATRAAA